MNIVFFLLVLAAVVAAGGADIGSMLAGEDPVKMAAVGTAAFDGAKASVTLAVSLAGAMTLFLGLMKVVEAAGGLDFLARLIRPVLVRLFPDVPADHPAMGAIVMNIGANVLGLGNAATPFGIKAMQELETLNKHPGTATNAMVLFLAINTSGVAVLPTGVMAMRAAAGSATPEAIFVPTLVASMFNTVVAVLAAKVFSRFFRAPSPPDEYAVKESWLDLVPLALISATFSALVVTVYMFKPASAWIVPVLILGMLTVGFVRRVKVYEVFIDGAKDGFSSATRIIPYLVAILTAVGMLRASGGLDAFVKLVAPAMNLIGMPPEVLPLALLRPLSGSGAYALTTELTTTYGPDTFIAQVAGTMQGTTETTFYVLAVYFGAVQVLKTRHAVPTGLVSDISGVLAAVAACHWLI
jgi:spore maturation protein SpmA